MTEPTELLKLISTDFDGTIHEEIAAPPMPMILQELLGSLQEQGVKWVINTGREMASLMEVLGRAHIRVRPDYLILVEREIYRNDQGHYVPVEPWNGQCTRDHAALFLDHNGEITRLRNSLIDRFEAMFYEDPWSPLCAIASTNGQMDAIHAELDSFCAGHAELVPVRNDVYIRLSHVAYSKGTALAELQRILGVSSDKTLIAGDHLNDLPMLKRCYGKYLVAPANAISVVKEQVQAESGWIMPQTAGNAVFAALRRVIGEG
jgi:HAD superfamily hydrolase (TIGR01484 family)